jgi:hypothetical protein
MIGRIKFALDFKRDRSRRMTVRLGLTILLCLLLGGCASQHREEPVCLAQPAPAAPVIAANLALGPSSEVLDVAGAFTWRSQGPAIEIGYVLNDFNIFSDVQVDEQFAYDRFGGYSRFAESARSLTLIR